MRLAASACLSRSAGAPLCEERQAIERISPPEQLERDTLGGEGAAEVPDSPLHLVSGVG